MWQARFRRWYDDEIRKVAGIVLVIHKKYKQKFLRFEESKSDMTHVNNNLIRYRGKMRRLVASSF
jgi:hypothetical protein